MVIFYLLPTRFRKDFGDDDPGKKIREMVWDKIEPYLNDAHVVLICPDGATARFPWSALPGKTPGSYLIEERAIAVVPVSSLLPQVVNSGTSLTHGNKNEGGRQHSCWLATSISTPILARPQRIRVR